MTFQNPQHTLGNLQTQALSLMQNAGYPIQEEVLLEVDDNLPFMGYTSERNGKTLIVVSGWSLTSDMSMGLIIHELSHVYRTETNHPSHNFSLHNKVLQKVFEGKKAYPYQQEITHTIINNIQDLYADDISFAVYIKEAQKENLNEFFLGWVRPPLESITSIQDKWKSAELLLSAAFAQANLERHKVADTGGKIENAVKDFLSRTEAKQAQKFTFFKNMMVHFPEKATNDDFEKILTKYLTEFLKLAKSI